MARLFVEQHHEGVVKTERPRLEMLFPACSGRPSSDGTFLFDYDASTHEVFHNSGIRQSGGVPQVLNLARGYLL